MREIKQWQADVALVLVTAIWGSTFIIVKQALDVVGPLVFVAGRFWVATMALTLGLARRRARFDLGARLWRAGALTGGWLTVGFVTQTIGLQTTAAGKAAFITGLSVVLVPIFAALLLRDPPTRNAAAGVVLATAGLGLMTLDATLQLAAGDLWVLACAVGFAGHILSTGHFAPRHDVLAFTWVQLLTAAILTSAAAVVFEAGALAPPRAALPAMIYMGLVASALVFGVQTGAQRHTTATHTALIFALEPVWAAVFAVTVGGEVLAAREWIGGGLILLGMIVAEVRAGR